VYGQKEEQLPVITVIGAVGDFHDMTPDGLATIQDGLQLGLSGTGLTTEKAWLADPGPLGGTVRCLSYETMAGQRVNACTWGDKGSVGTVLSPDRGRGREAAADLARAVREAVLHRGTPADSATHTAVLPYLDQRPI
jgi:hypothetical protein